MVEFYIVFGPESSREKPGCVQEIADADAGRVLGAWGAMWPFDAIIQREVPVQQGQDPSPDSEERIRDFLGRHGGAGASPRLEARDELGTRGWYEIVAADGYRLRCDWSRTGDRDELRYSEISPENRSG